MSKKEILIIIPSRSSGGIRNRSIKDLIESWKVTTSGASDVLLGLDEDDHHYYQPRYSDVIYDINQNLNLVPKINLLSMKYVDDYKYFFFMGDDHRFRTPGWEEKFLDQARGMDNSICFGDDGNPNNHLPTSVFITSKTIKKLGYFAPPCLKHMYADNFWLELGNKLGCLKYFSDVLIEHMHHSLGKSKLDKQYERVDSLMLEDGIQYKKYLEINFLEDIKKLYK
jgi:hypothetical protein